MCMHTGKLKKKTEKLSHESSNDELSCYNGVS